MTAREEVARLLAEHVYLQPEYECLHQQAEANPNTMGVDEWAEHVADVLIAEEWIDDRPVPCGSEAYIPSDYYRTENYGWVRCGGYRGEGHVHEDSNTGYQWDDAGNPLR